MASLYLSMSEKLSAHWKAHGNAYPRKFVLTPDQHEEYVRLLKACASSRADFKVHLGVPIEVAEGSPGVMISVDGTEVPLL
jgi:hypothetical protein